MCTTFILMFNTPMFWRNKQLVIDRLKMKAVCSFKNFWFLLLHDSVILQKNGILSCAAVKTRFILYPLLL